MRVKVVIHRREESIFDIGDMRPEIIRDILLEHEGAFTEKWTVYDVAGMQYEVDSVEVTEMSPVVSPKASA